VQVLHVFCRPSRSHWAAEACEISLADLPYGSGRLCAADVGAGRAHQRCTSALQVALHFSQAGWHACAKHGEPACILTFASPRSAMADLDGPDFAVLAGAPAQSVVGSIFPQFNYSQAAANPLVRHLLLLPVSKAGLRCANRVREAAAGAFLPAGPHRLPERPYVRQPDLDSVRALLFYIPKRCDCPSCANLVFCPLDDAAVCPQLSWPPRFAPQLGRRIAL